jgi:hypothetical protein
MKQAMFELRLVEADLGTAGLTSPAAIGLLSARFRGFSFGFGFGLLASSRQLCYYLLGGSLTMRLSL